MRWRGRQRGFIKTAARFRVNHSGILVEFNTITMNGRISDSGLQSRRCIKYIFRKCPYSTQMAYLSKDKTRVIRSRFVLTINRI